MSLTMKADDLEAFKEFLDAEGKDYTVPDRGKAVIRFATAVRSEKAQEIKKVNKRTLLVDPGVAGLVTRFYKNRIIQAEEDLEASSDAVQSQPPDPGTAPSPC